MSRGNLCRGCGESFASMAAFDAHRLPSSREGHPFYGKRCMAEREREATFQLKDGVWAERAPEGSGGATQ